MSLVPEVMREIPVETARVARAAFPNGSFAIRIRDELGVVFNDEEFAALFPVRGQPAYSPWRLALVSALQFAEGLSDRRAADAVRGRIDWKYALGLELDDTGFNFSVLSEFRSRLVGGGLEERMLQSVLDLCRDRGLLKAGGRQRTDATHVLAAIRDMSRLEMVGETLRATLNAIAVVAPEWLMAHAEPEWFDRYRRRIEDDRLPQKDPERTGLAEVVGTDGIRLLRMIDETGSPDWLREIPVVRTLREMWEQQYELSHNLVRWRSSKELPAARSRIVSPYDPEARTATKRDIHWDGYKVHLTETCEPERPHLITHAATTPAAVADVEMTDVIQIALAERSLLPDVHLVDGGYVDAHHLVASKRDHGIEILGPAKADSAWQTRDGKGFSVTDFEVDWDAEHVSCPNGKTSVKWRADLDCNTPIIRVAFSSTDCGPCPFRDDCTKSRAGDGRRITLRPQAEYQALQDARRDQTTHEWKMRYNSRAGIEGTISQSVHVGGLRRSRYRGLAKTHLQNQLIAVAVNLLRLDAWLADTPFAATRTSSFAALQLAA